MIQNNVNTSSKIDFNQLFWNTKDMDHSLLNGGQQSASGPQKYFFMDSDDYIIIKYTLHLTLLY